ncbi:hypothetical protein BDW66DRAFT_161925 [Aspergillus desertorum]
MELTRMVDTSQGRRRRRAYKACAWCQRRKKRCQHPNAQGLPSRVRCRQPGSLLTALTSNAAISGRFVGEMNLEAVIQQRLHGSSCAVQLHDRIGLWVPFSASEARQPSSEEQPLVSNNMPLNEQRTGSIQTPGTVVRRCFESAHAACRPLPSTTRAALFAIYFTQAVVSPFLERAICLVAAKSQDAAAHLYLSENSPLVSPRAFCLEIYRGLCDALTEGLEPDRITRIRVLALMSLHVEDSEGSETASMHLAQAINQAQTVRMQIRQPGDDEAAHSKLFWCLWSLDRLLASMFGRPCHLRDDDISLERPHTRSRSHQGTQTPFDIWMLIKGLLSDAIQLYRPHTDPNHALPEHLPAFQELVGPQLENSDFATLSALELHHYAVCIVFHRLRSTPGSEHNTVAQAQRGLAAIRIQYIIATESKRHMPPLRVIPYALSLAVSVFYQQYRSSKLVTNRTRLYSAEAIARLGHKALQQIRENDPDLQQPASQPVPQQPGLGTSLVMRGTKRPGTVSSASVHPVQGAAAAEPLLRVEDLDTFFDDFLDLSLPMTF